jgi:fatty-acid desaturase
LDDVHCPLFQEWTEALPARQDFAGGDGQWGIAAQFDKPFQIIGWERFFNVLTAISQNSSYLNPRGYAVLHRMHHAYSDTEGDPHTPQLHAEGRWGKLRGLWYSHMPWMLSRRIANSSHFARDSQWKTMGTPAVGDSDRE